MNDHIDRLRSLGDEPIDPETKAAHLRRIDAVGAVSEIRHRRRFGPLAVAGAAVAGFVFGSAGLTMAGALPDRAQDVAHDVLGVVQVDVPHGKEGKRGPCVSEAAKIEDEAAKQAAKDACPKGKPDKGDDAPGRSGEAPGQNKADKTNNGKADKGDDAPGRSGEAPGQNKADKTNNGNKGNDKHADDPCKGRPPWAGPMSPEEKAEAKAAGSHDACVDDDDVDGADVDDADDDDTVVSDPVDEPTDGGG